jgi:hypothetical protein
MMPRWTRKNIPHLSNDWQKLGGNWASHHDKIPRIQEVPCISSLLAKEAQGLGRHGKNPRLSAPFHRSSQVS